MPAAARYIAIGEPRPPAPITSTARVEQLALPGPADVRQDDVPRVALDLLLGERRARVMPARNASSSVISPSRIQNDRSTGCVRSTSESRM